MKKLLIVMLCLAMVVAFAACAPAGEEVDPGEGEGNGEVPAESDWAYIQDKGTLIIGITIYPPMNYKDEADKLVGFDTEFAEAVCAKLGITPEFITINWDTKELELDAKTLDCIWNGLTVSEERAQNMAFSQSYVQNNQVAVIRTEDIDKYTDMESIADAKIVAEVGSAGETAVKNEALLIESDFAPVAKQTDAITEVSFGTADVAVIDVVMANAIISEDSDFSNLTILDLGFTPEEYAIGFRLGSDAVAVFNTAIDELLADGTLAALAEKYGLTEVLIGNQE